MVVLNAGPNCKMTQNFGQSFFPIQNYCPAKPFCSLQEVSKQDELAFSIVVSLWNLSMFCYWTLTMTIEPKQIEITEFFKIQKSCRTQYTAKHLLCEEIELVSKLFKRKCLCRFAFVNSLKLANIKGHPHPHLNNSTGGHWLTSLVVIILCCCNRN